MYDLRQTCWACFQKLGVTRVDDCTGLKHTTFLFDEMGKSKEISQDARKRLVGLGCYHHFKCLV